MGLAAAHRVRVRVRVRVFYLDKIGL